MDVQDTERNNMNKTIEVRIQNVYGNDLIYPICPTSKLFAEMLGTKTLTRQALGYIKRLGYEIRVQSPDL